MLYYIILYFSSDVIFHICNNILVEKKREREKERKKERKKKDA